MNEKEIIKLVKENIENAKYINSKPSGWSGGECEEWFFNFNKNGFIFELRFHPYPTEISLIWIRITKKYKKLFGW